MPIHQPSQYQVDNMKQGDIIYIRQQKPLYRLYRKLFLDKPKIKVRQFWGSVDYNIYYQEDCTLLYYYEVACVQNYDNEVPVIIGANKGNTSLYSAVLKTLQVGLYNVMMVFSNGLTITVPTEYFSSAIRQNQMKLKTIEDSRMIDDLLKFQKYKGSYFKKYVKDNDIFKWTSAYCSVCGKPVEFIFEEDKVLIKNKCECGELVLDKTELTYDEFSIWYYNQTSDIVKKRYDKFWFRKE